MASEDETPHAPHTPTPPPPEAGEAATGLPDFVRRALSAGFEAASGSKDLLIKMMATEVKQWLDHMDLNKELVKALSKMTVEVKAEFRFRPNEEGKLTPEVVAPSETRIRTKSQP